MKRILLVTVLSCGIVGPPAIAASVTCQPTGGGGAFVSTVVEVPAAAVKARGAETCDQVYRIDGQRYELGGCNRRNVALWSPEDGAPIGHFHPRLALVCR